MRIRQRTTASAFYVLLAGCGGGPPPSFPVGTVTLSRLNPDMMDVAPDASHVKVYGFELLATLDQLTPDTIADLKQAISDARSFNGTTSSQCFEPRLLIHFGDEKTWSDYVICTACRRLDVHTSDGKTRSYEITDLGVIAFDRIVNQNFPKYPRTY